MWGVGESPRTHVSVFPGGGKIARCGELQAGLIRKPNEGKERAERRNVRFTRGNRGPGENERNERGESERACTWWHVERRGSWEGPAHQTAAIHLAHGVLLSPTLFSWPFATLLCSSASLSPHVHPCLRRCRLMFFRVHVDPLRRRDRDGKPFGASK